LTLDTVRGKVRAGGQVCGGPPIADVGESVESID